MERQEGVWTRIYKLPEREEKTEKRIIR